MFQGRLKGILREISLGFKVISKNKFQRYFKGVSRKFQGCSKKVFRMLQERFKGVSSEFKVSFKNIQKKLNGCLREVSKVF